MDCGDVIALGAVGISLLIAVFTLRQNRKIYNDSIKPLLSASMVIYEGYIILKIKNTGRSEARNINIQFEKLADGDREIDYFSDSLFSREFDLFPEETICDRIAHDESENGLLIEPVLNMKVSYTENKLTRTYSRMVSISDYC